MKKHLFFLSAAAMMLFSACSQEETVPGQEESQFVQNVNRHGKKSSEVDMNIAGIKGFTAKTRGCDVNGNTWLSLPEYPSTDEIAGVMEYIASNPGGVEWPGWTYYYVQHVGGAHHMYSYKDGNGAEHNGIDGTSSQEFFQVLENNGNWQHVYNFNAGKCDNSATHNAALMNNGFNGAKTLNEYASNTISAWRLFKWNGNYYLGIDFSAKKGDGEIPGDGIYDDWVVKIIPGAGETVPEDPDETPEDPEDPETPDTPDTPDEDDPYYDPYYRVPSVEVDIHHQQHNDWNELKTSIHLRDTVDVRVFIPVSHDLQAVPDDFDIRSGVDYTYLTEDIKEVVPVTYTVAGNSYSVDVQVNHKTDGIEILIAGADCAAALRDARGVYDDGITFEIHSYLYPELTPEYIWNDILKKVEIPETSLTRWPGDGSCVTITYGQIHSAYYEDETKKFLKEPAE